MKVVHVLPHEPGHETSAECACGPTCSPRLEDGAATFVVAHRLIGEPPAHEQIVARFDCLLHQLGIELLPWQRSYLEAFILADLRNGDLPVAFARHQLQEWTA